MFVAGVVCVAVRAAICEFIVWQEILAMLVEVAACVAVCVSVCKYNV